MRVKKYIVASFLFCFIVLGITAGASAKTYTDENGLQYERTDDGYVVTGYKGTSVDIVIPDTFKGENVVSIALSVFSGTDIQSVVIGNSIEEIYSGTFENCKQLTNVTFGNSVKYLDSDSFHGCEKLRDIKLPASLEWLDVHTFEDTAFYNDEKNWSGDGLYLDGWLAYIREGTSGYFKIEEGTEQIAGGIFKSKTGCHITTLEIPASLKEQRWTFTNEDSALTSFVVNKDNPYYSYSPKEHILYNKDRTKICEVIGKISKTYRIPESVTEIGRWAFDTRCGAKVIIIPKGVKRIGYGAFAKISDTTGLLCEAKKRPKGWDLSWAISDELAEISDFPGGTIHYGYRPKAVQNIQGLYDYYYFPGQQKKYKKTFTVKKREVVDLNTKLKTGTDGYVRWVSTKPSVLEVEQFTPYTSGFYAKAKKTGTVWLKAKNSKGKVIAQYKIRITAK